MNPKTMDVHTTVCMFCGNAGLVKNVPLDGLERWAAGAYIQDALPSLSAGDRQQLMTGTHDACFDNAFPEEEDEEYESPF